MEVEITPLPVDHLARTDLNGVQPAPTVVQMLAVAMANCRPPLQRYMLFSVLPLIASLSSMSVAVTTMLALPREAPLSIKIATPVVVWAPIALSSLWFQWYFNGRRADGLPDAPVRLSAEQAGQVPGLLAVALLASLANIFDAVMYAHAVRPQHDAAFALLAIALATSKWLTWCLTDLQAAWRKVPGVDALCEQSWAKPLYNNAYRLNILLREVYPVVIGLVYAQAFFKQMQTASSFPLLNALLALLIYQGAALSARDFDVRQNHDCSFGDNAFAMEGALAGSSRRSLRIFGRALNGQLLDDAMAQLGMPVNARTAVILGLNAAGLVSVLQQIMTTFLVSNNYEAVAQAKEAFVVGYYASPATTLAIGARITPAVLPLEVGMASVQAYVRAATIKDQVAKDQHQPRVVQVVVAPLEVVQLV